MHIGFVSFESPFGSSGCGIAAYLRAMIPSLIHAGHRVTLITAGEPAAQNSNAPGFDGALRTITVKLPNAHWYVSKVPGAGNLLTHPLREVEWSFAFQAAVDLAMRQDPVDILEVTELGTWRLARRSRVPLVARLHGAEYTFARHTGQPLTAGNEWTRTLQRTALSKAAAVTSPSRFHAQEVSREMHWNDAHVAVVPNGISQTMLNRAGQSVPREPGSSKAPVILYTGRLARVKGTLVLLEAAKEVLRELPEAEFRLAGPWQMPFPRNEWNQRLDRLGIAGRITWLGYQNEEQLAALYRTADVFVMPSFYETFGISCLEAMAFQAPVVATRAGALPEVVEHGKSGVTVAPGDATALAAAIVGLLRDPALRRRLGSAGRDQVLSRYTPEAVSARMMPVYEQACSRGTGMRTQ